MGACVLELRGVCSPGPGGLEGWRGGALWRGRTGAAVEGAERPRCGGGCARTSESWIPSTSGPSTPVNVKRMMLLFSQSDAVSVAGGDSVISTPLDPKLVQRAVGTSNCVAEFISDQPPHAFL